MRASSLMVVVALQSIGAGMALSGLAMVVAAFGYLPPVAGAVLLDPDAEPVPLELPR